MDELVTITQHDASSRYSLRTGDPAALSAALALELPRAIGASAEAGPMRAACLGPDEWMLFAHDDAREAVEVLSADVPFSLVDISDREVAIVVEGSGACDALLAGCPRDVERLPVGWAGRTVFEGVAIVLVRRGKATFEIHVARSSAPFVIELIDTVRHELALGL